MYRLVPALVAQMGRAFPELPRAQSLIEETLLLRGDPLQGHARPRPAHARRGARPAARRRAAARRRPPSGSTTPSASRSTSPRTRCARRAGASTSPASRRRWPSRRPRRAPPGPAPARRRTRRSGSTSPSGTAPTEFLGYDTETAEGQVLALVVGGQPVETRRDRRRGAGRPEPDARSTPSRAARSATPARSAPTAAAGRRSPTCARRPASSSTRAGSRRASSPAAPPPSSPSTTTGGAAIRANHSATHLLHEALRRALGDHVAQRGSLVAPDRLRFDFAHPKAMTPAELAGVEAEVNAYVRQNTPVETRIMTPDAARGARARGRSSARSTATRCASSRWAPGRAAASAPAATPIRSSSAAAPMSRAPATSAPSSSSPRAPRPAASAGSRR